VIPNRHVNRSTLRRTGSRAVFARFGADMFVPTCRHAVISGVFVVCLAVAAWAAAQAPRGIPDSLDDKEFWQLVRDLSEPDGFFEDENYVSNEMGYQRTMRRLQESVPPGGVFVGVGPEQNFAYVAALRPKMAFVLDIRRQNLIEHLMYKALFEVSGTVASSCRGSSHARFHRASKRTRTSASCFARTGRFRRTGASSTPR
jgi:hypothetical protein